MPKAFWTLRRILFVSDIFVLVTLILSVFWLSSKYETFSVKTFRDSSSDTLQYLVAERLGYRYLGRLLPIGDDFSRNQETVSAVLSSDRDKLDALLQILFHHVKELNITLRSVIVYDENMKPLAAMGTGESFQILRPFFENVKGRTKVQRRKILPVLWRSGDGIPLHSIIIPVGGFRARGFVELVTNPLFALSGLGSVIGGQLQINDEKDRPIFKDGQLSSENTAKQSLDTEYVPIRASDGEVWTTIAFTRDVTEFINSTSDLKYNALVVTLSIILAAGFFSWILVRQTVHRRVRSFANTMVSISQGNTSSQIPPTGPDEMRIMAHSLLRLREAVEKVEASERRLRTLLEASPIGVSIIKKTDGKIMFANTRMSQLYGIEEHEMSEASATEFQLSPVDNQTIKTLLEKEGVVRDYEMQSYRNDSSPFWSLVTMQPFSFRDENAVIVWAYDITERVQAETALRQRIAVDELLTSVSREFIDNEVSQATNYALTSVSEFTHVDRSYVCRLDQQSKEFIMRYEWLREGLPQENLLNKPLGDFWSQWVQDKLANGEPVIIDNVEKMDAKAENSKNFLKRRKVKSNLIIPLRQGLDLVGFLGIETFFDYRNWLKEEVQFLKLVGEVVAIGLARGDAEIALRESQERFELAVSGARDGIFDIDFVTRQVYTSSRWLEMLGLKKKMFKGTQKEFLKLVYSPDRKLLLKSWRQALNGKKNQWEHEYRMIHSDGSLRWILLRGTIVRSAIGDVIRFVGAHTDFTERKEIEKELADKTLMLELTMDSMQEGIIVFDQEYNIISWNDNYLKIMNIKKPRIRIGFAMDDLFNELVDQELFRQDDLKAHVKDIKSFVKGSVSQNAEIERLDGRFLSFDISPMKGGGLVVTYRDITESKKVERMKNEFVSTVSHELRTPLTSIGGSLGLISGGAVGAIPDKALELVNIAATNCDRLVHLINDILDIEKIESGKMDFKIERFELAPLIERSVRDNQGFAEKFDVLFTIDSDLPNVSVHVDGNRLIQVMTNFLSNAAKFSPKGEKISIAAKIKGGKVCVSVEDRGPGIPEEFQDRIFGKFAQADSSTTRKKGGTGLGLNISKAIIEKLGGKVGFKTKIGKGTTFFFELPVIIDQKKKAKKKDKTIQEKVLICENDQKLAEYIKELFVTKGYKATVAKTAKQAKSYLKKSTYDLLTLDIKLPDQNGVDFLNELRVEDKTKDIPAIILTGAEKNQKINLGALGILDWLKKPFDEKRLLQAVQKIDVSKSDKPNILHVEDDVDNARVTHLSLQKHANITLAETVSEARELLSKDSPSFDLVILDLALPDESGLTLLSELNQKMIPVLVFSASELENEFLDKVVGSLVKSNTSNDELIETILKLTKKEKKE